ncbi:hypothetical protein D3C86_1931840 [compost metagenome]
MGKYSTEIRPLGIFSVAKQKLCLLAGKAPYSREQAEALERLTQSVTVFLAELGIQGGSVNTVGLSGQKRLGTGARQDSGVEVRSGNHKNEEMR